MSTPLTDALHARIRGDAMSEYAEGGIIPEPVDITIHVTECIIGPEAARTRTWTCSRTDQPHLNLRHQGQPEQPARFDNPGRAGCNCTSGESHE